MGAGRRRDRTTETSGVQTPSTAKGRGATKEIDACIHIELLLSTPKRFSTHDMTDIERHMRVLTFHESATTDAAASSTVVVADGFLPFIQPIRPTTYS